ncbi:MAG TPA: hypothetical protein VGM21_11440 [Actinomycetota bacterium]|jgi:hypothetical protein
MPIRSQVLIAAGGLLALLAMSMAVAIIPVMNLNHDRTHLSDRDMRYLNAAAAAAVNAIAITASLGADRALRKTYGQSLADALARGGSSIQSTSRSVVASSSRSVRILLACFLTALAIGVGVAFWLVRSIAIPVSRLMAVLRVDMPSRGSA